MIYSVCCVKPAFEFISKQLAIIEHSFEDVIATLYMRGTWRTLKDVLYNELVCLYI